MRTSSGHRARYNSASTSRVSSNHANTYCSRLTALSGHSTCQVSASTLHRGASRTSQAETTLSLTSAYKESQWLQLLMTSLLSKLAYSQVACGSVDCKQEGYVYRQSHAKTTCRQGQTTTTYRITHLLCGFSKWEASQSRFLRWCGTQRITNVRFLWAKHRL